MNICLGQRSLSDIIWQFADFGYAQFAPGENHQADAAWIAQVAARGTDGHIAPVSFNDQKIYNN